MKEARRRGPAAAPRPGRRVLAKGLLQSVRHQTLADITLSGPPLRFFDHNGTETTRTEHLAPPALGADDGAIRAWLELPDERA
jgi:hypothetical protein